MTDRPYDAPGLTSLDFMLACMHDPDLPIDLRLRAAEYAAPYQAAPVRSIPAASNVVIRIESQPAESISYATNDQRPQGKSRDVATEVNWSGIYGYQVKQQWHTM
jgi:hypothetical protein